jgi:hypothetical protein
LACLSIYATDALSHRFWKFYQPEHFPDVTENEVALYGEVVRDAYRQADIILAELQRKLAADTRLVIVSDHGFEALQGDGGRVVPRTEPLQAWLDGRSVDATVLRQGAKLRVHAAEGSLDEALAEFVEAHRLGTGAAVFRVEPIPGAPQARGVAVTDHETGVELNGLFADGRRLDSMLRPAKGMSGDHHRDGIFIGTGPGTLAGKTAHIEAIDVTPIVLAGLQIPVGADMVGRVPEGLWPGEQRAGSWSIVREEIRFVDAPDQLGDDVNQALRALGYVD